MSGVAKMYDTTLEPSKEAVVAGWIATQPWYRGRRNPTLVRVGGFRFVDPEGEVGIETLLLREEGAGPDGPTYHVPVTYRSAPWAPAGEPVGTLQHGVLGLRYVYDGAQAPVYLGELIRVVLTGDDQAELSTGEPPDVTVRGSGRETVSSVIVTGVRATSDGGGDQTRVEAEVDGLARTFDVRTSRVVGDILLVGSSGGELAQTLDAKWVDGGVERTATLAVVRAH